MTRVLVGLFEHRGDAERLVEHLTQQLHVDPAAVEVHGPGEPAASPGDLLRRLTRRLRGLPREDAEAFGEGARRGGAVVAAEVPEAAADRAMDAFEAHGAVDLDARAADWRGAGWALRSAGTGHDEDIGYATHGDDAVIGHVPRHHHDDAPAGLLGRWAMAAMRGQPGAARARVRSYVRAPATPGRR